jgi:hypothetical protein
MLRIYNHGYAHDKMLENYKINKLLFDETIELLGRKKKLEQINKVWLITIISNGER